MSIAAEIDSSREIACTKFYNASVAQLIRMWSNPEHITNWWGPHGFTTTTHAMEFKTEGVWRFTMHGPDGTDYPNFIRYTNITSDTIEYEHRGSKDIDFTARVKFKPQADGTEMSFTMTFPTPAIRRQVVEEFKADEGLRSTVTRLGEYTAKQDPEALELVIVRQFATTQERVWDALTDPQQLRQWLAPIGLDVELHADEPVAGGHWNLVMSNPDGMHLEAEGEYLAIEPTHFLKMTHRWKKDDGSYKPTTTITYSLHTFDGKTTMTFAQTGFWSEEARAAHLCGWDSCMYNFAVLIGATKANAVVKAERQFNAPIDVVWNCWTKPEHVASWFAPKPYTCPRCEIDLRPGGRFYLVMRSPSGEEHAMSSIICDIEEGSRLGWVSSVADENGELAIQNGTTVMFEDLGGRTKVTVYSYAAAFSEPGKFMVGGMEQGWNMTLDQMVEVVVGLSITKVSPQCRQ